MALLTVDKYTMEDVNSLGPLPAHYSLHLPTLMESNGMEELFMMPKPIEVKEDTVAISPSRMETGKVYPFKWAGVEVFALKRSEKHIDFYAVPPGEESQEE